jgi:hypothetical protein
MPLDRLLTLQALMKKFEAQELLNAIRRLMRDADLLKAVHKKRMSPRQTGVLATVEKQIKELTKCCESADLPMSVLALKRLLLLFPLSEQAIAESIQSAVLKAVITVEDELSLHSYFSLEPNEAELYSQPWAGWEKIVAKFPDTNRDIEEMNKCFALGRYTAAMFHALHVAEWGAIKLGDYIGVADPKKGWGPAQKKLRELVDAGHSKLPANLKGQFDFLEQMNREIQTMVLAWRHKVDHAANHLAIIPNTEFTPEVARHIMGAVKVFLSRLEEGIP